MSPPNATMIMGDIQKCRERIQFITRQIGFLDVRYPDDRNGTEQEIAARRAVFVKKLDETKEKRLRLCREHAQMDDGFRIMPGTFWCGLAAKDLAACGYKY